MTVISFELGRFDLMDYTEMNFMRVANTSLLGPLLYILLGLTHYIVCKITKVYYKKSICRKVGVLIYKQPVWDGFSRIVFYCYLELILCCFIAYKETNYNELMENGKTVDKFSYIIAYISGFLLFLFPLVIIALVLM